MNQISKAKPACERNRIIPTSRLLALAVVGVLFAVPVQLTLALDPTSPTKPAAGSSTGDKSVHSPTTLAWELQQKNQVALMVAAAEEAKGTPAEWMFRAQEIFARWPEYKKSRAQQVEMANKFVANLNDYLNSQPQNIDARWALDNAKFLFAAPSEQVITRLEYWANSEKDRRNLEPMAKLAARLLKLAGERIDTQLTAMESDSARRAFTSDDAFNAAYMKLYATKTEIAYNQSWAQYFLAMSLAPSNPERKTFLTQATESLKEWADGPEDSGVKFQSLLLRGKVYSELGKISEAIKDLTAASNAVDDAKNPIDWVRYQAHYQLVVAQLRRALATSATDSAAFTKPHEELATFKAWITSQSNSPDAMVSADMLGYRIAWAQAGTLQDPAAQKPARQAALQILSNIVTANPKVKELVYEQLATQITDDQPLEGLAPLQAIALAWSLAQVPEEPADQMHRSLLRAMDAAEIVRKNKTTTPADYVQATLIKAIAADRLKQYQAAAELNLEYVNLSPNDPRAKELVELTLSELYQLRKSGLNTPEIQRLNQRALELATGKFQDKRYIYAQGVAFLDVGKLADAQASFTQITKSDPSYYDARYQLVLVAVQKVSELAQKGANPADQKAAARELLAACTQYLDEFGSAPAEVKKRMEATIIDLRLIQISTAISPLEDAKVALQGLEELDRQVAALHLTLDAKQQAGILRYRIISYSKLGQSDKVAAEIKKLDPKDAPNVIKNLVLENQREIDNIDKADPQRARGLAATVASLLEQLVKLTADPKDSYIYRQWRADMLLRSGKVEESGQLWNQLRNENNQDIANDMGAARALFFQGGHTKEAEDYFMRILPKLPAGTDSYWEAYLRIIQCREAQNKSSDEIKDRLRDLKTGDTANFGGKAFKKEFQALASKYGV